ncbi:hypothetical protein PPE_00117 [Paenibacillus polymyxa E681]|nr:hypothetical protein PPE_00117 [Paenibacillus polymyxa E681]
MVLEFAAHLADRMAPAAAVRTAVVRTAVVKMALVLVVDLSGMGTNPAYQEIVGSKDLTA